MSRLTATEAARAFSELLNRVATGEEIEITRAGAPIAVIGPAKVPLLTAERFRKLLAEAPAVDEEFADEVRAIRTAVAPPETSWPS
jgi:prevent-host-death family protein